MVFLKWFRCCCFYWLGSANLTTNVGVDTPNTFALIQQASGDYLCQAGAQTTTIQGVIAPWKVNPLILIWKHWSEASKKEVSRHYDIIAKLFPVSNPMDTKTVFTSETTVERYAVPKK